MKKEFLAIGKIVGTHGVRGMVRIDPWADDGAYLKNFKNFYAGDEKRLLTLSKITPHGNVCIAAVEGINDIPAAETLRNSVLYIKRSDAPLPENRYFIDEIIGAEVINRETGAVLGVLTDVFKTGANDVWQISTDGKDRLVPVIPDINADVDIETNKITITPLKGIFDDED